jgi:hypothetical protein
LWIWFDNGSNILKQVGQEWLFVSIIEHEQQKGSKKWKFLIYLLYRSLSFLPSPSFIGLGHHHCVSQTMFSKLS